jgi:hypothetical protein
MYKRHFAKWKIKKNSSPPRTEQNIRRRNAHRSRVRYTVHAEVVGNSQQARLSRIFSQIRWCRPLQRHVQSESTDRSIERMLHAVCIITHGCFESHGFGKDEYAWYYPSNPGDWDGDGSTDADGCQQLQAQIDERTRAAKDDQPQSPLDMNLVFRSLDTLARSRFDTLLTCLTLFQKFQQMSEKCNMPRLLPSILNYMKRRARCSSRNENPFLEFVDALSQIEQRTVSESLRVARQKLCFSLESILGSDHPSAMEFWSGYCEVWGGDRWDSKIHHCQQLLRNSDSEEGYLSPRSRKLLDTLGRMVSMHPGPPNLVEAVALDQIERCRLVIDGRRERNFSEAKRLFRNAVVIIGNRYIGSNARAEFAGVWEMLVNQLEYGDAACVETAATDLGYLITYLRYWNLLDDLPRLESKLDMLKAKLSSMQGDEGPHGAEPKARDGGVGE